ncbi:MAG: ABC transporter substrate-binding protein [Planctomycetota bacterium]|jgi:ABC-type nitrate/sulfonate/bicarbonate transport system substrate-binding protein
MKKKSFYSIILVVLFLSVNLTLFSSGGEKADKMEGEVEIKTLNLHYQTNDVFVPHSVALTKGWFEEAGFEKVNVKTFAAGGLAGEAFVAGEIDVWTPGNAPVISMRHNGIPVVVVGMLSFCRAELMYVRNDAGVNEAKDLYNIRIGLLTGSTLDATLQNLARSEGLDYNRLQVVHLSPPDATTSLLNNDIQATITFAPFNRQILETNIATEVEVSQFSHTNVPIAFSEDFIRKNPNAAMAILKVLLRGQAFVEDPANKDEAMRIHKEYAEQPMDIIELGWDVYWNHPSYPNGHINQMYVDDMQNYTDFQERKGAIKNPVPAIEYTYTGFLKEIKPEFVEIEGKWTP